MNAPFGDHVPGPPPEELVELVHMDRRDVAELSLEGFVHHFVLSNKDLIIVTECIHILLGFHQGFIGQLLVSRSTETRGEDMITWLELHVDYPNVEHVTFQLA